MRASSSQDQHDQGSRLILGGKGTGLVCLAEEIRDETTTGLPDEIADKVLLEGEEDTSQVKDPEVGEGLSITPISKSAKKRAKKKASKASSSNNGSSSSMSLSFETWIKERLGQDEVMIQLVDEARQDVLAFFERSLGEMGREMYDRKTDELALKAAMLLLSKLQNGKQKGELESNASSKKLKEGDETAGEEECPAYVEEDSPANGDEGDPAYIEDECGNNGDYESDEEEGYLESSNSWIDELEEWTGVEWLDGVLMEIKSYMDVVYCKVRRIHLENEDAVARKACTILMEMDKADPPGGCLGTKTKLGRQLRANQEWLGGKLCRWAWRAQGPGYDE
ncbi:uncharacterized protein LOC116021606 [Ipomoea triloba]|uniref:uncharacterized protein LOC116021606 n=1 Tax=Ipomoea triloba TaxID=35885 RepID=UPI00125E106E|nr:uncharacterized protein LOC116021606 [Ipomoea triloba]XP_031117905.1 uncharacterized protein LOC116021606 [Ipomoea triloba]XP_031117906.1 uncharacterized protein LOC116021606 [Ipomoea triloba]XP_031117907.1 uncharacterized protein LOC116021606 [Ipomoea triloba]XP_031117908.1 uncharacterized protein LOC116021606 [Ipomoea triloba]XP_031117909.1 uncharacterized protein LOC116021606 [Ipomoea triloba]XP_031117910.1 uncharacterized protein LOC116021606 [Ipomoea triloba]XP_031117911.1 uncharacte